MEAAQDPWAILGDGIKAPSADRSLSSVGLVSTRWMSSAPGARSQAIAGRRRASGAGTTDGGGFRKKDQVYLDLRSYVAHNSHMGGTTVPGFATAAAGPYDHS